MLNLKKWITKVSESLKTLLDMRGNASFTTTSLSANASKTYTFASTGFRGVMFINAASETKVILMISCTSAGAVTVVNVGGATTGFSYTTGSYSMSLTAGGSTLSIATMKNNGAYTES